MQGHRATGSSISAPSTLGVSRRTAVAWSLAGLAGRSVAQPQAAARAGSDDVGAQRLAAGAPVSTVWRYTDHEAAGGMRTRFLQQQFFAAIARESAGRLRIEPHWNGALASSYDALKTVAAGQVADVGVVVPEYDAKAMPLQQLFKSFPRGPSGARQVEFFRRAYAQMEVLTAELARSQLVNLFCATGYPVAFFSRRPLPSLTHLRGQRWRTASFWHSDFLANVGAIPVSMRWGPEIFQALEQGALDGLMVNVDSGIELKVPQVAPHVLLSQELWLGHVYLIAAHAPAWQRLPSRDQQAVQRAAAWAYARLGPEMDAAFAAVVRDLRASGVDTRVLDTDEVRRFAAATRWREVQERWAAQQQAAGVSDVPATLHALRERVRAALNQA